MTPELTALTLAALLQVLQFFAYAAAANAQVDPKTTMGPRDTPMHITGLAGRLHRALSNHFEGLTLFTIAVVITTLSDQASPFTATCGWVYLAARVAYVPAYALGLSPWRTLIWALGFVATVAMLLAAVL